MRELKPPKKRKWYRIVATVYRNSDGHIERDSQELLIDGTGKVNASSRAYGILMKLHPIETHTINLGAPYEMK
jgi:hypothetical protein